MSANRKQRGSNILSIEAYGGRCPVRCDQCYVNFGRAGRMKAGTTVNGDSETARRQRAYASSQGWDGSLYRIWMRPSRGLYDMGPRLVRVRTGLVLPSILRIPSMGDSSYSKSQWCRDVLEMWGAHCFFNTTIRAVKERPRNLLEVFHKAVVTTNGGRQKVWDFPTPRPRERIGEAHKMVDLVKGTMTPSNPRHNFANFLEPATLTDIGRADQEHKVKFYRVRCLPTVVPRIETDKPVVYTVMRFNGIWNACEFARRYGMELRYESADGYRLAVVEKFGFEATRVPGLKRARTSIRLRGDQRNSYPSADEWSVLETADSWLRVADKRQLGHLPYVCDRSGHDCKACGLCATLDGTEPDNTSPIMLEHGFAPVPFSSSYIEVPPRKVRNPEEEDLWPSEDYEDLGALNGEFFADVLEDAFFCPNPGQECVLGEQSEEWITKALQSLQEYALQDVYFVESWNAHEHASTLLAYCFWALARKARRMGLSSYESWVAINRFAADATEGDPLFAPCSELMLVFDDAGPVVEMFGTIDEPRPLL
jgi:hypothetical protein